MSSNSMPRRPPHITVNSGSGGDILEGNIFSDDSQSSSGLGTSRNLVPQRRVSSGQSSRGQHNNLLYGAAAAAAESSEMLLPPGPGRPRTQRSYQELASSDGPSRSPSASPSAISSRRTSFSSDGGRSSRYGPFSSPFDDSRAPSRAGSSDDEGLNTQTVSEKYNIMPSDGLLLYPEDVEKDDWLHNPDPNDKDRDCNIFTMRGLVNVGGLLFLTVGIMILFIAYPILTFVRQQTRPVATCATDPNCLSDKMDGLKNIRTKLIDPQTPQSAYTKTSHDGTQLNLVFSDEFNTDGRTFYDGDDPYFQAVDIWYGVTQDLEWYDPDAITTANGTLNIRFDAFQSHDLNYRSGMLQSWNKLCFKGGRIEASISLPGRGDVSGFWPGFWIMGNLGRPGYASTTDGLWPYSYWDHCDPGITPNQSSTDGISWLPGMRLPACTCANQDHPSPGNSRSAPEIDALEASVGFLGPGAFGGGTGSVSQSFQAAPFDVWYSPDYNYEEIYDNSITSSNTYRGGPFQEALSSVTWLNNDWYDGNQYQTYGFEYTPGESGDITWFVGDDYTWRIDHRAIRPNGDVGQRTIPTEPMSVIMNFGMSNSFAEVFLANLAQLLPATMRFDYIRIYQDPSQESVTCDPPGYPTTQYIKNHLKSYNNPNLTEWSQTGYKWPTNTLMNGCSA